MSNAFNAKSNAGQLNFSIDVFSNENYWTANKGIDEMQYRKDLYWNDVF